jgi:lysine-specific demethylase 3
MCRLCGREACAECFDQVRELTEDRPGSGQAEIAALQSKREKHAHTNPFFLACTRRNEHQAKDFSPMSRFCNAELAQVIKDMEFLLCTPDPDEVLHYITIDPTLDVRNPHLASTSIPSPTNIPELTPSSYSTTDSTGVRTPPDLSSATSTVSKGTTIDPSSQGSTSVSPGFHGGAEEIPSHPTRRFSDPELTDDVFRPIWARGEPLVVTGLLEKFQIQWTPEYFIEKYSTQSCLVIECQTDVNKRVTVGEFFSWFGKYENRTECWKLKVCLVLLPATLCWLSDYHPRIGHLQQISR